MVVQLAALKAAKMDKMMVVLTAEMMEGGSVEKLVGW